LQKDIFRLYATPVVNIFKQQAIPIRYDQKHFEYPIIPEGGQDNELFSVEKVIGINKKTGAKREYLAFPEFRHTAARASGCHYTVKRNYSENSGFRAGLALGSHGSVASLNEEYLSVSLKTTNASLPRRDIRENAICNPVSGFPEFLHFINITRPSAPLYPPGSDLYLWTVLSQFNVNFHTLCRKDVLQESLRLYDWSKSDIYGKWIRGIINVAGKPHRFIFEGNLISGSEITIRFRDAAFDNKGESNIFGMVLLAFFTSFATLNHLVSLTFIFEPSGDKSHWGPLEGQCHAI
jgi:type VI secretion system protein ImpG